MSMISPGLGGFISSTNALIKALGPLTAQPNVNGLISTSDADKLGAKKGKSPSGWQQSVEGMANWADKQGVQDGELTLEELEDVEFDMMSLANSGVGVSKGSLCQA